MRERVNAVKVAVAEGRPAYGVAIQMNAPETIEVAGAIGYDFIYIDCEHGSLYLDGLIPLLRAAEAVGLTAFVRVPNHEPSFIMRVLDAGAMGIVVPRVSTSAEAEAVVAAARYKFDGNTGWRGACPGTRATWHQTTKWEDFVKWSNQNISVIALLETEEGLKNFEQIAAVEGLDATMFGPFDLAHEIGLYGRPNDPQIQRRYNDVIAKARKMNHLVIASLFSHDPVEMEKETRDFAAAGVNVLVAGGDRRILFNGLGARLKAMRAAQNQPQ